jgi:hypothetical protein
MVQLFSLIYTEKKNSCEENHAHSPSFSHLESRDSILQQKKKLRRNGKQKGKQTRKTRQRGI